MTDDQLEPQMYEMSNGEVGRQAADWEAAEPLFAVSDLLERYEEREKDLARRLRQPGLNTRTRMCIEARRREVKEAIEELEEAMDR